MAKGCHMAGSRCSCGFSETPDELLTDHLLEIYTPPGSIGNDALVHEEMAEDGTCSCGFIPAAPAELDRHFLAAFTPADSVGHDGRKHTPGGLIPGDRCPGH